MENQPEPWLRGPIPEIPVLLQPIAFALTQSREDVQEMLADFAAKNLWIKPAGRASVAFHLQHMAGVLDRMMTYARAEKLSEKQLDELSDEGLAFPDITMEKLVRQFETRAEQMLSYLKIVDEHSLTEKRTVGRKTLPSSVIGILFHAAEHIQRHTGQLLVTVSVLNYSNGHSQK